MDISGIMVHFHKYVLCSFFQITMNCLFRYYEYTFVAQASDIYCKSIRRIVCLSPLLTPHKLSFYYLTCSFSYIDIVIKAKVGIIVCGL